MAVSNNLFIHQCDFNNVFLHGDLVEEMYMLPPPGYCKKGDKRVCKLNRSIYGLKQTSIKWFTKLSESLDTIGFIQSKTDSSLFTKKNGSFFTFILCYVDDMIIIGNSMSEI